MPPIPDEVERRDAVRPARDCLTVDEVRALSRVTASTIRVPPGQIVARPAEEPHPFAILVGDASEAHRALFRAAMVLADQAVDVHRPQFHLVAHRF